MLENQSDFYSPAYILLITAATVYIWVSSTTCNNEKIRCETCQHIINLQCFVQWIYEY